MFASLLSQRLREALDQLAAAVPSAKALAVTPAADSRFGDYQSNAALMLAKGLRTNPRQLAAQLIEAIDVSDIAETPEIAGPGFINFRLRPEALAQGLESLAQDPACGVQKVANPQTIVIDFSAPNVAKPMHVGHIRSTFLGDALARIARFLGHRVIKDNHLGDWGTQFGMVLYGWKQALDRESLAQDPLAELLRLYRHVNALLQADESLRELCKAELVKLQAGDAENLSIWKECVAVSQGGLETIYQALEIRFDHWLGESFYNDRLPGLVEEFLAKGVATESEGAICIFSDREGPEEKDPFLIQREGEWQPNPAIIRKADGGFLYATTDLATIEYRIQEWKADEIWYVVGAPQQLHFRQVFSAASRAGWEFTGTHIAFGSILGQDRKLMKTRSGDNVQLQDVLDESIERARAIIEEKNPDLPADEKEEIARTVGLGAIKYAELSQHRLTDYVFSWDKMLSLQGNTAPYLMYSYVRIQSIFRKAGQVAFRGVNPELSSPEERALALKLTQFGESLPGTLADHRPNLLANYLFELATTFHSFFEACPVLKSEGRIQHTRLMLCEVTAHVLKTGLSLLGIKVPSRM